MAATIGTNRTEPKPTISESDTSDDGIPTKLRGRLSICSRKRTESMKVYKRRVYDTLHHINRMEKDPREVGITTMWPNTDWHRVWKNLTEAPVPGEKKQRDTR
jgi:hypothetical protein